MAINLEELAAKLADDAELSFGEGGTIKGADLKGWLAESKGELTKRDTTLGEYTKELQRLKEYEVNSSKLFETAARLAATEGDNPPLDPRLRTQQVPSDEDEEFNSYLKDPLYSPVIKKVMPRLFKEFQSNLENTLKPQFETIQKQNQMLTNALIEQQTVQKFRDAGEWPEGWDLKKVIETGRSQRWFVPGGEQWGLVDINRVHEAVITPINRQKEIEKIRADAKEDALRELRMNGNVIQMPNREMSGTKRLKATGTTPEQIFGGALDEASKDLATQRLLQGIKG